MKTWKPDTCGCEVEEIYNGKDIVGMGQVLKKCVAHTSVPDNQLYEVIYGNVAQGKYGENRQKNHVLRVLLGYESVKDLGLEEMKRQDGKDAGLGLKEGIEYAWSFEGDGASRVLKVEVKGISLSKTQKDAIKAECDVKFESGKVELV